MICCHNIFRNMHYVQSCYIELDKGEEFAVLTCKPYKTNKAFFFYFPLAVTNSTTVTGLRSHNHNYNNNAGKQLYYCNTQIVSASLSLI